MLAQIRKARQEESGFTLIELLIVIVILGVLAGIVIFAVNGINNTSVQSACRADYKTVMTAQEAYFAQTGGYAASVTALETAGFLASTTDTVTTSNTGAVVMATGATRNCAGVTP
jgi:prepilin-type N-terminal cleavage/methylation domain-containing protein